MAPIQIVLDASLPDAADGLSACEDAEYEEAVALAQLLNSPPPNTQASQPLIPSFKTDDAPPRAFPVLAQDVFGLYEGHTLRYRQGKTQPDIIDQSVVWFDRNWSSGQAFERDVWVDQYGASSSLPRRLQNVSNAMNTTQRTFCRPTGEMNPNGLVQMTTDFFASSHCSYTDTPLNCVEMKHHWCPDICARTILNQFYKPTLDPLSAWENLQALSRGKTVPNISASDYSFEGASRTKQGIELERWRSPSVKLTTEKQTVSWVMSIERATGFVHTLEGNTTTTSCSGPQPCTHSHTFKSYTQLTSQPPASVWELRRGCTNMTTPPDCPPHPIGLRLNDEGYLAQLNAQLLQREAGWEAGANTVFDTLHTGDTGTMAHFMGTRFGQNLPLREAAGHQSVANPGRVPAAFDSRKQWPHCTTIGRIRNQSKCGACWAFSAVETLADRFCTTATATTGEDTTIKTGASETVGALSPEFLVDCDPTDIGCEGGWLDNAWRFLVAQGTPTEAAYPYTGGKTENRSCNSTRTRLPMYHAKSAFAVTQTQDVSAIMAEILAHGPGQAAFYVTEDFMRYKSGVYTRGKYHLLSCTMCPPWCCCCCSSATYVCVCLC